MIAMAGIPRPSARTNQNATLGSLDLNKNSWRASWRGESLNLTATEFTIVSCLATRLGIDLTYWRINQIGSGGKIHAAFKGDDPRGAVRSHIKRIRAKFCAIDPDFDRVKNCREFGYRWRRFTGEAGP